MSNKTRYSVQPTRTNRKRKFKLQAFLPGSSLCTEPSTYWYNFTHSNVLSSCSVQTAQKFLFCSLLHLARQTFKYVMNEHAEWLYRKQLMNKKNAKDAV